MLVGNHQVFGVALKPALLLFTKHKKKKLSMLIPIRVKADLVKWEQKQRDLTMLIFGLVIHNVWIGDLAY